MDLTRSVSCLIQTRNSNHCKGQLRNSQHCPAFCCWRGKRFELRRNPPFARLGRKDSDDYSRREALVVSAVDGGANTETAVVEKPTLQEFQVFVGNPMPFGATALDGGVNFSVYSTNASSATLCLISLADLQENRVTEQIHLDPSVNKTGDVWHVFLRGDFENMLYGYKFDGKFSPEEGHYYDSSRILLDPYAKAVLSRGEFGALAPGGNCWPQIAGMVPSSESEFDWEGDLPLRYPQRDLIIYEMHVRGFTKHESSKTNFPGTYLGVVEKLDHLKELGVNCIELMPSQEFNELEYYSYNSVLGDCRLNFWGYSTVNYFSPMIRYSDAGMRHCGRDAINELKILIREAHKRGIEVLMDIVFNHTAEGNEQGPILSFRGIDNSVYYMLAPKGEFYNYSGCGNTFNCNHPIVRQFILDCLRYWVTEMHVDGFRFDLASILTRGSSLWDAVNVYGNPIEGELLTTGTPLGNPPLIDMISKDPVLRGVKLIAEAWDTGGLYQVGSFPHGDVWSEWNGQYRDIVRQFIKGTYGFSGAFAECLCGSPNLYQGGGRKPWNSINFVCAHDGFSLADLVTYNNKHNLANGEDNNDGENHNNSWNCGQEGEFVSLPVKKLRKRQMRNFFLCLMVSQGVPMIYMGDEYGHTKGGNNNTYCHDNYINYFRWDKKEEFSSDFFRFCCLMTKFRQECESLGLSDFPTAERLQWHGHAPGMPNWSETSRFVAFSLVRFNALRRLNALLFHQFAAFLSQTFKAFMLETSTMPLHGWAFQFFLSFFLDGPLDDQCQLLGLCSHLIAEIRSGKDPISVVCQPCSMHGRGDQLEEFPFPHLLATCSVKGILDGVMVLTLPNTVT